MKGAGRNARTPSLGGSTSAHSGKAAPAAPAPGASGMVPPQSPGRGGRSENKEDTASSATRRRGLCRSGLTSGTLHTLMYKYLPLAKVQAALRGCQTQQKAINPGKVFTAAVAKGAAASKRDASDWPAGPPVTIKHLATGHQPLGSSRPSGMGTSSMHSPATATTRPTDVQGA